MTRMVTIVNTSNHANEDIIVHAGALKAVIHPGDGMGFALDDDGMAIEGVTNMRATQEEVNTTVHIDKE